MKPQCENLSRLCHRQASSLPQQSQSLEECHEFKGSLDEANLNYRRRLSQKASQAWWLVSITLGLGRWRNGDQKVKVSLAYTGNLILEVPKFNSNSSKNTGRFCYYPFCA